MEKVKNRIMSFDMDGVEFFVCMLSMSFGVYYLLNGIFQEPIGRLMNFHLMGIIGSLFLLNGTLRLRLLLFDQSKECRLVLSQISSFLWFCAGGYFLIMNPTYYASYSILLTGFMNLLCIYKLSLAMRVEKLRRTVTDGYRTMADIGG